VETVVNEMVKMHGGEVENTSTDNEKKMKGLFDGY